MKYMDSLRFVTARQSWLKNLFMIALCMFIPVIGPIVVGGYMFEVFDALRRDPEHKDYPEFDFGKFSPYLMRGIWLFLVQMILQVIIMVPIGAMYALTMIVTIAARDVPALIVTAWVLYTVGCFVLGMVSALVAWPALIYAGVRQAFDFGGMLAFIKSFIKSVGKELVVSILFLMAVGMVMGTLGWLLCCVGVLFAAAALMLAQHHLKHQLYDLYLERGGTPIPEKAAPYVSEPKVQPG